MWLYPGTDLIASVAPFNNLPNQYRIGADGRQGWFGQCGLESRRSAGSSGQAGPDPRALSRLRRAAPRRRPGRRPRGPRARWNRRRRRRSVQPVLEGLALHVKPHLPLPVGRAREKLVRLPRRDGRSAPAALRRVGRGIGARSLPSDRVSQVAAEALRPAAIGNVGGIATRPSRALPRGRARGP
jgi:hypothetical protein